MTICIGMRATNGIVIAADAQESDQYYKRSQQKIIPFVGNIASGENPPPPQMGCVFTGAGDAGYLDAFFAYAMEGIRVDATQADFEHFLADKVRTFHEKHLFPLAVSPNPPEISVLVGAYVQFSTSIFVSHGSTLRRTLQHTAVGAGAHFALSVMDDVGGMYDLRHTELLAAYIVGMTKDRIEGCGNYTAMFSIKDPCIVADPPDGRSRLVPPVSPLAFVPHSKIRKWEQSFGTRWASRQVKLIAELADEELADDLRLERTSESRPLPESEIRLSKP